MTILAQEKEAEKPKETEKSKEVEKPKVTSTQTEPHSILFQLSPGRRHNNQVRPIILQPADVTALELIFEEIVEDVSDKELCFPEKPPGIEIITKATNPHSDVLFYEHVVTGGRIIGQGERVFWDLSNVKAGDYTITAAVDNGCGFCGKTITKTVVVK